METIAELVGGCADGVQLDSQTEPDDWPDYLEIDDKRTGARSCYRRRSDKPTMRGDQLVYFFDVVGDS